MSQGAIVNPNRAIPRFRLNNVTPFTYRDGLTYLEILEQIREEFNSLVFNHNDAIGAVNDFLDEVTGSFEALITQHANEYQDFIDTSSAGYQNFIDTSSAEYQNFIDTSSAEYQNFIDTSSDEYEAFKVATAELYDDFVVLMGQNWSDFQDNLQNDILLGLDVIAGLTGEDGAIAHLIGDTSSETRAALDAATYQALLTANNQTTPQQMLSKGEFEYVNLIPLDQFNGKNIDPSGLFSQDGIDIVCNRPCFASISVNIAFPVLVQDVRSSIHVNWDPVATSVGSNSVSYNTRLDAGDRVSVMARWDSDTLEQSELGLNGSDILTIIAHEIV